MISLPWLGTVPYLKVHKPVFRVPWRLDTDPDHSITNSFPDLFCSGFKDANKQKFFPRFICLWVSVGTVHLHKSSKIKIYKEVTKLLKKIKVFVNFFWLLMVGFGSVQTIRDPDLRDPKTNASGSGTLLLPRWYMMFATLQCSGSVGRHFLGLRIRNRFYSYGYESLSSFIPCWLSNHGTVPSSDLSPRCLSM